MVRHGGARFQSGIVTAVLPPHADATGRLFAEYRIRLDEMDVVDWRQEYKPTLSLRGDAHAGTNERGRGR